MTGTGWGDPWRGRELPIDPDVDPEEDARHHRGARPVEGPPRPAWPRFRASVIAVVFVGGCAGGLLRYVVTQHWPTSSHAFPWSTFTVNVAGAFILAALIVIASDVLGPTTYLRPLVGTGFCGALTTFSSIVVAADQLIAHGRAGLAAAYLTCTIAAGLAAAWSGLSLGRLLAARRRPVPEGVR